VTAAPSLAPGPSSRYAPIVLARNVLAIVDDGCMSPDDYAELERHLVPHPAGYGGVVIIPEGAKPPSEPQRKAIGAMLIHFSRHLRALVWVVEARGFQGAATRCVLTGLSLCARRPYRTHVTASVTDGLGWLALHFEGPDGLPDVAAAVASIAAARAVNGQ
jgi:hypothetical protein